VRITDLPVFDAINRASTHSEKPLQPIVSYPNAVSIRYKPTFDFSTNDSANSMNQPSSHSRIALENPPDTVSIRFGSDTEELSAWDLIEQADGSGSKDTLTLLNQALDLTSNDPGAKFVIGRYFADGLKKMPPDPDRARELLTEAAHELLDTDDSMFYFDAASFFAGGHSAVSADSEVASQLLDKAAQRNIDNNDWPQILEAYARGIGTLPANPEKARTFAERVAADPYFEIKKAEDFATGRCGIVAVDLAEQVLDLMGESYELPQLQALRLYASGEGELQANPDKAKAILEKMGKKPGEIARSSSWSEIVQICMVGVGTLRPDRTLAEKFLDAGAKTRNPAKQLEAAAYYAGAHEGIAAIDPERAREILDDLVTRWDEYFKPHHHFKKLWPDLLQALGNPFGELPPDAEKAKIILEKRVFQAFERNNEDLLGYVCRVYMGLQPDADHPSIPLLADPAQALRIILLVTAIISSKHPS
jgi:hypothetical protein